jgi:hypothetical protein
MASETELMPRLAECPETGSRWRHYKGGVYVVVGCAMHEGLLEPLVLYRDLDGGITWARPLGDFQASVRIDGVDVPRFVQVG